MSERHPRLVPNDRNLNRSFVKPLFAAVVAAVTVAAAVVLAVIVSAAAFLHLDSLVQGLQILFDAYASFQQRDLR